MGTNERHRTVDYGLSCLRIDIARPELATTAGYLASDGSGNRRHRAIYYCCLPGPRCCTCALALYVSIENGEVDEMETIGQW